MHGCWLGSCCWSTAVLEPIYSQDNVLIDGARLTADHGTLHSCGLHVLCSCAAVAGSRQAAGCCCAQPRRTAATDTPSPMRWFWWLMAYLSHAGAKVKHGGCEGSRSVVPGTDVLAFYADALAGLRTRREIEGRVDRLITDLEQSCTQGLASQPEVLESLQGMAWQLLHDGPRTLRVMEQRIGAHVAAMEREDRPRPGSGRQQAEQLGLLRERVRLLREYNARTAAHGQEWPARAPATTHEYPSDGCGSVGGGGGGTQAESEMEDAGWLGASAQSLGRWGGGGSCSVRVLSAVEWEEASPVCLAALFTRPFVVRGGGAGVLNRSLFTRRSMLRLAAQSTLRVGPLGGDEAVLDE
jgi:hypothetical protein